MAESPPNPDQPSDRQSFLDSLAGRKSHTIASLRLNLEEAKKGRTWLLLPDGFRSSEVGLTYPLPTKREDLVQLALIPIKPYMLKRDAGCAYIRRAHKAYQEYQAKRILAVGQVDRKLEQIKDDHDNYRKVLTKCRAEAREELERVRAEAEKAVASLSDLFALGRKGIEGQMKAHLDGTEWQGEPINAEAFRQCFRLVSQAVKGLGLPSDQRASARDAVFEELAAAIKNTQETVGMAAKDEGEPN